MPDSQCPATREMGWTRPRTVRRCDREAGHDGPHITDDGFGRAEYAWQPEPARA